MEFKNVRPTGYHMLQNGTFFQKQNFPIWFPDIDWNGYPIWATPFLTIYIPNDAQEIALQFWFCNMTTLPVIICLKNDNIWIYPNQLFQKGTFSSWWEQFITVTIGQHLQLGVFGIYLFLFERKR